MGRVTFRDSAGVEIVTIPESAFEGVPRWRLSTEPILSIGEIDGDEPYLLASVRDAAHLGDGGIVILEGRAGELRVFDAEGRFVRSIGRRGEGPGEFLSLSSFEATGGDTLVVYDRRLRRATVLTAAGELVETREVDLRGRCPGGPPEVSDRACSFVGFLSPRTFLVEEHDEAAVPFNRFGIFVFEGRITRLQIWDPDTVTPVDSLPRRDEARLRVATDEGRPVTGTLPRMFGGSPVWATTAGAFAYGDNANPRIRWRSLDGSVDRVVALARPRRPVTEADVASYKDLERPESAPPERMLQLWFDEMEPAEHHPYYGSLILDRAGRLWVRDHRPEAITPPEVPDRWVVIGADGRPEATATLPPGIGFYQIHEIGADYLLAQQSDDFGVPRVLLYGIEVAGSGG